MIHLTGLTINLSAFLETIKFSEIGPALLAVSDDGYDVEVGSTPQNPILFPRLPNGKPDYNDHPNYFDSDLDSTAAGAFQIIGPVWSAYKQILSLPDFSPPSQEAVAIRLITECKAPPMIESGQLNNAIFLCSKRWASLPGSTSGQPQQKMAILMNAFTAAGGTVAA